MNATRFTTHQLNSDESPQAKRHALAAERRAAHDRILAELDVTRAESALFTVMNYGMTMPPDYLPEAAVTEDQSDDGIVTEQACRDALAACLKKGWLQIVDEPALASITNELTDCKIVGPIYGLPRVGDVDFTIAGAALHAMMGDAFTEVYDRLLPSSCRLERTPFAYTDVIRNRSFSYYKSKKASVVAIDEARRQDDCVSITGPEAIGPWRVQWWRRFPTGYRVEFDHQRKWEGRAFGGGADSYLADPEQMPDRNQLFRILDQNNLTLSEWLILATMEGAWCMRDANIIPRWASESAQKKSGVAINESECQIALENCIRRGWLRQLDQEALDEIEGHLRNDPVILPVPAITHCKLNHIDFTPDGANLYQSIAADWLGADWEDRLHISKEYFWEEHHYCESEAGFAGIVARHEAEGKVVVAQRIVSIGPWCVHWWKRFPAGYRLELEMSEA